LLAGVLAGLALSGGCNREIKRSLDPRIAVLAKDSPALRACLALANMGQVCDTLASADPDSLQRFGVVIVGRRFMAGLDSLACRESFAALVDFAARGGCVLIFGLEPETCTPGRLPATVRFATDDPSGWGNYDETESIAYPEHPLFNRPHHLTYLAGIPEPDRIISTPAPWNILLAKEPEHPGQAPLLVNPVDSVGSLFELAWGKGRIVVCQPQIEQYYAGGYGYSIHPLEGGLLLFENLIQYARCSAASDSLPWIEPQALPRVAAPGDTVRFELEGSGTGNIALDWDLGDGSTAAGASPSHVFSADGIYRVRVRLTDSRGAVTRGACLVQVEKPRCKRWGDYIAEAMTRRYYPDPGRPGVNYRTALFMDGLLDLYQRNQDPQLLDYIDRFFHKRLIDRWDRRPYKGDLTPDHDFVDIYSLMSAARRMFGVTGDSAYLAMCREVWDQDISLDSQIPSDSLWTPWTWRGKEAIVDFEYFETELRADYFKATGDMRQVEEAARQMLMYDRTFRDPKDDLYFQAISFDRSAFYCSPERPNGLNDSKWGRADGWMAMAWAELLEVLPADSPYHPAVMEAVRKFFTAVVAHQDSASGLWALITDKQNTPGIWMETTSSSMFVYSLIRLVELGALPREPFLTAARHGYNGLQTRIRIGADDFPFLSDACEGTLPRLDIARWIASHRRDNDFHVLGPYLRAEEALWRVCPPVVGVLGSLRPELSRLGQRLNRENVFFYQIPELSTDCDLILLQAVVVDRGAFDRNEADTRARLDRLLDYAASGGTVFILPQSQNARLAAALPPGLVLDAAGKASLNEDENSGWEPRERDGSSCFVRPMNQGFIVYCENDPPAGLILN